MLYHLTLCVNVKHIVQQNYLQSYLWSLHCILDMVLVFSHAEIVLDMDTACTQEQGRTARVLTGGAALQLRGEDGFICAQRIPS